MGKLQNKINKAGKILIDYGADYMTKRNTFKLSLKLNPQRQISYEEYERLIKLTPRQLLFQREEYLKRPQNSPRFLVHIWDEMGDEDNISVTKESLKKQTYLPKKTFIGKKSVAIPKMAAYISQNPYENTWIIMLRAGDVCSLDFLYEIMHSANESDAQIIYTDHIVREDEGRVNTYFKPDYDAELLCSWNYIGNSFAARAQLYSQDLTGLYEPGYQFLLDAASKNIKISHTFRGLYERRTLTAQIKDDRKIKAYIKRYYKNVCGEELLGVELTRADADIIYAEPKYASPASVSVLIPNKDHVEDLDKTLFSLSAQTVMDNLEIIIIENNSEDPATQEYYGQIENGELYSELSGKIKIVTYDKEGFDFSAINNYGAAQASGEYLLFLNNDVELKEDAVEKLLSQARRADVCAVGAKLLYPDETIQHAGVIVGMGGGACHAYAGMSAGNPGYLKGADCIRNVSALTAACLMVRAKDFNEIGGFSSDLPVNYGDIDLCLRLKERGKLIYVPMASGIHYESKSRGEDNERLSRDLAVFRQKYAQVLEKGDDFYSRRLSLSRGDFSCGDPYTFERL